MRSLLDLTGRVAIVTGASGNIGGGIARRLHEAGAAVVVHGSSHPEAAEALAAELGERAVAVRGDVERDAAAICRRAVAAFGALHVARQQRRDPAGRAADDDRPRARRTRCCASTSAA